MGWVKGGGLRRWEEGSGEWHDGEWEVNRSGGMEESVAWLQVSWVSG